MRKIVVAFMAFGVATAHAQSNTTNIPTYPFSIPGAANFGSNVITAGGLNVGSKIALNSLLSVTSPILSPETQNSPSYGISFYTGAPVTQGWADTWSATSGNGVYSQMITDNLTLSGSPSVHYGLEERTLNVLGTSTSGELNVSKFYLLVNSGVTASGIVDPLEAYLENAGTVSGNPETVNVQFFNDSAGSVPNGAGGVTVNWGNSNTTAGSLFQWSSFTCTTMSGSGAQPQAGRNFCLSNLSDPTAEIATVGHVALRASGTAPALSNCGTSPSLASNGSDMAGIITEGSSATGCTLTFTTPYSFNAPQCIVTSPSGSSLTSYSASGSALTIVNSSASGNKYAYVCFAVD